MPETIQIRIEVDSKTGEARVKGLAEALDQVGKKGKRGLDQAGDAAERMKRRLDPAVGTVQKLGAAFAAWKLVEAARGFLDVAASAETTNKMLERLTGSAARGREAFDWILDFRAPAGVDALQSSFVKLQAVDLDPMAGRLQAVVDAVAAFGGSDQELIRATAAIQQMAGKGVISMEELRQQLAEAVPTAARVMAAELGMSVGEMSDVVSQGALDAQTGLNALFTGFEKRYGGAAEKMMDTWTGLTVRMGREWTKWRLEVMESGPFQAMRRELGFLMDDIGELSRDGSLVRWARQTAEGTMTAFELMAYGPELMINSVRGVEMVFASVVGTVSAGVDRFIGLFEWINAQMGAAKELFGLDSSNIEERARDFAWIREYWQQNSRAAWQYGADLMASMEKTHESFGAMRRRLADIQTSLGAAGSEGQKAGAAMAEGFDAALGAADALDAGLSRLAGNAHDLYRELYTDTGYREYADKAVAAYQKILDKDEASWAQILGSEEDARRLRIKREQQFVNELFGHMDRIVEAEEQTAEERVRIAERAADRRIDAERYAAERIGRYAGAGPEAGPYTGLPVGFAGGYWESTMFPGRTFATYGALQDAKNELIRSQEELARATEDAARKIIRQEEERARAAEAAVREIEREAQARARENDRLADSLAAQHGTVTGWLADLATGSLAAVQSAGAWSARYQELFGAAMGAEEGVSGFLSYAESFLEFQRQFSGGMDYAGIYGQVVRDVQALEGLYGDLAALSDLGFGSTAAEVLKLKSALDELGIPVAGLEQAARGAGGRTAALSGTLQGTETPFENVTGALEGFSANALAAARDVEGFFSDLAESLGITYSGSSLPAAVSQLTPPDYSRLNYGDYFAKVNTDFFKGWRYLPTDTFTAGPVDVVPVNVGGQWWAPRSYMNTEQWINITTGETRTDDWAGGPFADAGGVFAGPQSGYPATLHGIEAVIPLKDGAVPVTIKAEAIGSAVAKKMAPFIGGSGGEVHVHLHLDGREVARAVARQANSRHPELVEAIRRASRGA